MEESTGEGGLRRIHAELMHGCASATNFRPAAVIIVLIMKVTRMITVITVVIVRIKIIVIIVIK